MKQIRFNLTILVLFSFLSAGMFSSAWGQNHSASDPSLKVKELIKEFDNEQSPGGVIMVMRDGKIIYNESFGMANLTWQMPFEVNTPTNIGSTAKQFTAYAIAVLEEQGLLSADDDIRKHIPELPDLGDTVRIRHLIAHTSGYREFINLLMMTGRHFFDYFSRDEIIPIVQRQPALQNKPGETFNYNNTGYALLAVVIERTSGEDFAPWMRKNVFEPLGMHNTLVRESITQIIAGRSAGYTKDNDTFIEVNDIGASAGAGGIYSTTEDLAKWIGLFFDPPADKKRIIEKMQQPFVYNSGDPSRYAWGLIIGEMNGLKTVQHDGADMAHRSMLMMFPEIKGAVVTQSNHSGFSNNVSARVAEAFFADVMEMPEKEEQKSQQAEEEFVFDPAAFAGIAGRYELEVAPGFFMEFMEEDGKFYTQATGQPRFEIFASNDSTFYLTVVDASMTFHRNEEGEAYAMTLHQNGNHKAKRVWEPKWEPSARDREMYQGVYFSQELETFYTLAFNEDQQLVIQHRRWDDIKLSADEKDYFLGSFPIQNIRFVRDENDVVTGFEASSGRSFGILFEKQ